MIFLLIFNGVVDLVNFIYTSMVSWSIRQLYIFETVGGLFLVYLLLFLFLHGLHLLPRYLEMLSWMVYSGETKCRTCYGYAVWYIGLDKVFYGLVLERHISRIVSLDLF